jgi:hypothetical protein
MTEKNKNVLAGYLARFLSFNMKKRLGRIEDDQAAAKSE